MKLFAAATIFAILAPGSLFGQAASRELAALIRANDLAKIKAILAAEPASVNREIEFHGFPLHVAIREFKPDLVRYFLEQGADPNQADKEGETAAHYLARLPVIGSKNFPQVKEVWQALLDRKLDINRPNAKGSLAVRIIATDFELNIGAKTRVEYLQFLVEKGADVKAEKKGSTPLIVRATARTISKEDAPAAIGVVKFLVEQGCDVNAADAEGNSALLRLVKRFPGGKEIDPAVKAELATYLIEHGANPRQKNLVKESPQSLVENKDDPLYGILRRKPTKK